jgi:hypothetical protein
MEAVSLSETSIGSYRTTECNISENNCLLFVVLLARPKMKRSLLDDRCIWDDNIKIDLKYILLENVKRIHMFQDSDQWRDLVNMTLNLRISRKAGNFSSS